MFHQFQFSEFRLDAEEEYLYRGKVKINISRRAVQVLRLLVENPNKIITKQEFFDAIWVDAFVEEANLSVAIATIRKVLGDDPKRPQFIENLPRKGYRFIGDVRKSEKIGKSENIFSDDVQIADTPALTESDAETNFESNQKGISAKFKVSIAVASVLLIVAIIGIGYQNFSDKNTITSVAVLPFENNNAEIEHLSDGLAETVANSLAEFPNLRVISRDSTFQYKNKRTDAAVIGRELNVDAVLTGKITKLGERATVRTELTDVKTNRPLWSKEYEKAIEETFVLQSEMVSDISGVLKPVAPGKDRIAARGTDNSEAYLLYLKGRYHWNKRTDINTRKAIEYYQQSLDNDPTFALTYVGLAACYSRVEWLPAKTTQEKTAIIESAAQKALEIDHNLGEAYAIIALNQAYHEWNMPSAAENFRRAIELSPNYSTGHHWHAEFLAMQGKFDESFREYDAALALDPLSFAIMTDRAFNYYYARQYDRAIEELKKVERMNSDYQRTYQFLSVVYQEKGMFEEALAAFDKFHSLQKINGELSDGYLAIYKSYSEKSLLALRQSGADGYWQSRIDYETFCNDGRPPGIGMARIYAKLGDYGKAFEHLDRGIQYRDAAMIWMKVSPEWERLRSDPRFVRALIQVGLD